MFGGLDVKGGSDKKEEKQGAPGSSFSFMNGGAPSGPQTPAAEPSPSGFSFMGGSPAPSAAATGASGSSFSFMQPAEEAPAASGFAFMGGAPATAPEPAPVASGFGFMGGPPAKPSTAPVDTTATGAGVTFGGSAAQKKNIKRRARAPRVGAGVAQYSSPPAMSTPEPIKPAASYGSASGDPVCTKDQAEEAVRRAEEFLQSKIQSLSKLGSVQQEDTISAAGLKAPTSQFAPEHDDELEEAKRAAEEAQARLAREGHAAAAQTANGQKSSFSWFGGLRKSDSSNGVDARIGNRGMGATALAHAVMSTRSSESSMTGIPSPSQSQHPNETPAAKMLREQEEIKRAMAERHLKMSMQEEDVQTGTVWDRPTPLNESAPSWSRAASDVSANSPSVPSWGVKAPAPPPPSPRELMEILLQQFAGDVKRAMNKVAALRQQRNMLLEERFVAFAKERLAVQQIVQTETQQMDAAEHEDFDLADRLQVVLDGHNREKAECSAILDNISKALAQLDEQTPDVIDGVAICFKNVEEDLKEFERKQKTLDSPADAIDRFAVTAKQLSSEDERLKSESKHLEREEDLVKLERSELDAAIAEQTSELDIVRDTAKAQLDEVEKEMDELREQLRLKAAEAQQLRMRMESQDAEVSRVLVKFNRQINRVQKKETSIQENHTEWKNEQTAYEKLKGAHEAEVRSHSEALLYQNELLDTLKAEISMAYTFQDIISQEITFEHAREENEEADGHLAQLQADVVKCEAAVSEAAQLVKAAEATLVNLDGESRRLLEKLPKLEAEKKNAAAKRDFKSAGKASKEIKEATVRLKELEETLIDEAKEKRKESQADLEKVQKELDEEKSTANEKEKISGMVSMLKVAERIKTLLDTKMKVCCNASADTVKGIGALVLKGQIDALKSEGQSLGEKFGGWEEIVAEIEDIKLTVEEKSQETSADPSKKEADAAVEEKPGSTRPIDEVIAENVEKGKELTKELTEAEEALAVAVEEEDYDKAAELDEVIESLKAGVEKLDLTNAESELIISGGTPTEEEPAVDDVAAESGEEMESVDKEDPEETAETTAEESSEDLSAEASEEKYSEETGDAVNYGEESEVNDTTEDQVKEQDEEDQKPGEDMKSAP